MTTKTLNNIKETRKHLLQITEGLTTEQLNQVPAGFNNNIIWNVTHLISAQQGVCYTRAGMSVRVEDRFYSPYRRAPNPMALLTAQKLR